MRIVLDSNIVFSAILNTKSKIGQLIIDGSRYFNFYSIVLLKSEILEHKDKILEHTTYSQDKFAEIYDLIINRIVFLDEILLTDKDLKKATELASDIDEDDILFVALSEHLLSNLWTGDKKLIKGLKKKGYQRLLTTDELYEIFLEKQLKKKHKRK
jgi:predicted nucleic acid-binding protein